MSGPDLGVYTDRDWHLAVRPGEGKRILALDGGGVRGLITLGILKRIEETLAPRYPGGPEAFRLCHYFDLIAGTSTGAIIATALALGMRVSEVQELYARLCPDVFGRPSAYWGLAWFSDAKALLNARHDASTLEDLLRRFIGDMQLQSKELRTGFMLCAKRIDTGSAWVLTNSPRARFWESPDGSYKPNKEYELWRLLRASTAAPFYFEPIEVVINEGGTYDPEIGLFVDGAVGGLNNPSLQAFQVATLPPYGFGWPSGRDYIHLVSVGTGWWRNRQAREAFKSFPNWRKAKDAMAAMIQDVSLQTITTLQALSEPRKPWRINGELETLSGHLCHGEELLSFQRYDAMVELANLERVFAEQATNRAAIERMRDEMRDIGSSDPAVLRRLYALGHAVGSVTRPGVDGIEAADFPAVFDPPGFGGELR